MRNAAFKLTLACSFAALLAIGCCKEYCIRESLDLQFTGVYGDGMDSILVKKFDRADNFIHQLDSFYQVQYGPSGDTVRVFLSMDISLENNYEVRLLRSDQTFQISNITTTSSRCNCGNAKIKKVRSAVIDGTLQTGETLYLRQ